MRETVGIQQNVISDQQNAISLQQSRIDTQQNTINTLGSTLSSLTNTVSGLQSQMTILSSSSGGVNINKPNTWEVGHEYDFGNRLYGQRFTGTVTANSNEVSTITLCTSVKSSNANIVSYGGFFEFRDSGSQQAINSSDTTQPDGYRQGILYNWTTGLTFRTFSMEIRTNASYDVWVLYIKK